jgi:hypothetical protein
MVYLYNRFFNTDMTLKLRKAVNHHFHNFSPTFEYPFRAFVNIIFNKATDREITIRFHAHLGWHVFIGRIIDDVIERM